MDKGIYISPFTGEQWYQCATHNTPYANGNRCPTCDRVSKGLKGSRAHEYEVPNNEDRKTETDCS